MRVLIAPDKFKGTLTAREAALAIARGWRRVRPQDQIKLLPISDGGDGFGLVLAQGLAARPATCATVNAAGEPLRARWWVSSDRDTAIIESARIIGLAMLPTGRFHPFQLDTRGLARVLQNAARRGVRRCLVGIGGSATNDGGFGLARGLGWQFLDAAGHPFASWTELHRLRRLVPPEQRTVPPRIEVAVDVQNPLLGAQGCTRIYGPQKGLRPADFALAERNLRQLARVTRDQLGRDLANEPGAGAAGGLGFGLAAFANARLVPGFDLVARCTDLDRQLARADLVITGEGRVDASTFMGKGVGELWRRCAARKIPCLALAGVIGNATIVRRHFTHAESLVELAGPEAALAEPAFWLRRIAQRVAAGWPD
ncbi:MAG: glycerate kinase [Limisphaerales bacterium]